MLAVRRARMLQPVLARQCSLLTKMKSMEAETSKIAATLPEGLKSIAAVGPELNAELNAFATERPELYKAVLAKIAESDKPGIVATTTAAKDPKACKYTEEGTMLHEMMANVYKSDRRMLALADLEVTLTAKDKESLTATFKAKAAEKGMDDKQTKEALAKMVMPDKVSVAEILG